VYCLQAGDLTSGTFVGSFLQTGQNAWEERRHNRDDAQDSRLPVYFAQTTS